MKFLFCFLKTLQNYFKYTSRISGHDYIEIYSGTDNQVLVCKHCGKVSVGEK